MRTGQRLGTPEAGGLGEQWILGFVSGVSATGYVTHLAPLAETNVEGVLAWIDSYCPGPSRRDLGSCRVGIRDHSPRLMHPASITVLLVLAAALQPEASLAPWHYGIDCYVPPPDVFAMQRGRGHFDAYLRPLAEQRTISPASG